MGAGSALSFECDVTEALRSIAGPIFAAVATGPQYARHITVHAASGPAQIKLKTNIITSLAAVGVVKTSVRFHRTEKLMTAKSLEAFVARLGSDQIIYDPTGSFERGKALIDAARNVRSALGERISGLYYAPLLRTFYVTLERSRVATGEKVKLSELEEIEVTIRRAVTAAFGETTTSCPVVRVGFGLPSTGLVPVDAPSVQGLSARILQSVWRYWKPVTVAALFGFGAASAAQAQEAAVSESNLKLRGSIGEVTDDYSWNVEGAFTAPLGQSFGVQIEGGGGSTGNNGYYGGGVHLFTRDPESYLVGLFGAYGKGSDLDIDVTRLGGEFEFYLSELTISGAAGYQFSDVLGDKGFANFDLKWYANSNFAITAGAFGDEDRIFGRGRLEWQPGFAALPGLAFHADGTFGEDDYHSVMGGLTYYFGTPASLKDRHRRQDPESALFGLLQSVQQEQERLCVLYGC